MKPLKQYGQTCGLIVLWTASGVLRRSAGELMDESLTSAEHARLLEAIEADVRATKGLEVGPEHLRLPKLKSGLVSGLS